jgi:MoaA/NifB/PqqE/SkfB family radical SAM enzyme
LTTIEITDVLSQLKSLGIETVRLSGGEPLTRPDIAEIVKECQSLGFREIQVATNGLLLEKKAEELILAGADRFDVSLDGACSTTNDQIRGVLGHYDAVMKGVKEVKRVEKSIGRRIPVTIFTTLLRQNVSEVPSMLEMCEKLRLRWCFSLLCGNLDFFRGIDVSKISITDWKAVDSTFDLLGEIYADKKWLVYSSPDIIEYARNYVKGRVDLHDFPCVLGYMTMCLGSRGQVYPGCYVHKPVGNVRNERLARILKSHEYRELARKMYKRECSGCTFYYEASVMIRGMFPKIERLRKTLRSRQP